MEFDQNYPGCREKTSKSASEIPFNCVVIMQMFFFIVVKKNQLQTQWTLKAVCAHGAPPHII